ncbi:MAG: type II toxin-antitoxin system VapB family antitoxin [Treponemataceae bacterium]
MALSIRNSEVEQLARTLSRRGGVSLTEAIKEALESNLRMVDEKAKNRISALRSISQKCARLPDIDHRSDEDILGYDENGAFAHGGR